jgi:hypothetical protein
MNKVEFCPGLQKLEQLADSPHVMQPGRNTIARSILEIVQMSARRQWVLQVGLGGSDVELMATLR